MADLTVFWLERLVFCLFVYVLSWFCLCRAGERPVWRCRPGVSDEFSQVLRGRGEEDFVARSREAPKPQAIQPEDALEVDDALNIAEKVDI